MHLLKKAAFITIVMLTGINTHAQQASVKYEFSIQQCIDYANKNNVQVKNALLNYQNQQQVNREYTASALPTVSGSMGLTNYLQIPTTLIPAQFFGGTAGTYEPVQFGTKYNASVSAQLQQILFDGQVFVALQSRKSLLDFQQKNVEVTQETIKANVYKVYYQLVISQSQTQILDANINLLKKLQHDDSIMYKNGFIEKLDLDKVAVQLANLQTQKEKLLNSIQIGYLGLKTLLGMPVKDELVLTDKVSEDDIRSGLIDTAYEYNNRKEFQYLNLSKKLNEYNIKRYQLSYIPSVALTGVYSKNAQRGTFSIFGPGDWFTTSYIGLNISVPIFDGFYKDSKIKEAKISLQQTNDQIDYLKLSIDNEVAQARVNYATAIATLNNQKQNMQLAQSVYDQTKKKYETGTGSNIEINNAQTDLITAQTNYISAMYDAAISKVDYNKAVGKLK